MLLFNIYYVVYKMKGKSFFGRTLEGILISSATAGLIGANFASCGKVDDKQVIEAPSKNMTSSIGTLVKMGGNIPEFVGYSEEYASSSYGKYTESTWKLFLDVGGKIHVRGIKIDPSKDKRLYSIQKIEYLYWIIKERLESNGEVKIEFENNGKEYSDISSS